MSRENEIFISYAHLDDLSPVEGRPGWVSNLHRALEIRVAQLLGEKARIWRDPKLQGNDYFSDTLLQLLPKSEVLLSVFSPRYGKSEWCRRELEEFCKSPSIWHHQLQRKRAVFAHRMPWSSGRMGPSHQSLCSRLSTESLYILLTMRSDFTGNCSAVSRSQFLPTA